MEKKTNIFTQGLRIVIAIMLIVFFYSTIDASITHFMRNNDETIKLNELNTKQSCTDYASKLTPNEKPSSTEINQCIQDTNNDIVIYKKQTFNDALRFNVIGIIISIIGYVIFIKLENKNK